MTKARPHAHKHNKKYSSLKGTLISSIQSTQQRTNQKTPQDIHKGILPVNLVDNPQPYINQQSLQEIRSTPENRPIALSDSTSFAYTTVLLNILFYGISKGNLPLLYTACCMATALLGPLALKMLLPLLREISLPKGSEK